MFAFFKKTFRDSKRSIFWYSLILVLYSVLIVLFFPSVENMAFNLEEMIESYPPAMIEAFGMNINSLNTLEGFLSVEYLSLMWVIIIGIFAFSLGGSIVAGEVDKKTAEYAFTLPIKRQKIVLGKFFASYLILLFVTLITLLSIIIAAYGIGEDINPEGFLAFFVVAAALCFFFLAIATFFSCIFSDKGKVSGICGGVLVISYIIHILAGINEKVSDFYFFSFLKYYGFPEEILIEGTINFENILVLFGVGIIFLIAGLVFVKRRDL